MTKKVEFQKQEKGANKSNSPSGEIKNTLNDNPNRPYKVLIADLVGMKFDHTGNPDFSEVRDYIEEKGGIFLLGPIEEDSVLEAGKIHFFYQPDLSRIDEILPQTDKGQYDALIAAATFFPKESVFNEGGVRIGAGTGNMGSASWGGAGGKGGVAPLMNTPSFNSRATAQMVFKALLKTSPDLNVAMLHQLVTENNFDTGKQLKEFPTEKIEGKRIGIIGYGNIGRELAKIAQVFKMKVAVHEALPNHQKWIESEGFIYAKTIEEAVKGSDFITIHTGLGINDVNTNKFVNEGIISEKILNLLNEGAVVINYDRGELIDAPALDRALSNGKVRYAAIDADIFKNPENGEITGPMAPYIELEKKHSGKMELLPHAAADTEHISRVEGAKQAVDQLFSAIRFRKVINLKGDLPEGYTDEGAKTVHGVGKVKPNRLFELLIDDNFVKNMHQISAEVNGIWAELESTQDPELRKELIKRCGSKLILASNTYASSMESAGLKGPYSE